MSEAQKDAQERCRKLEADNKALAEEYEGRLEQQEINHRRSFRPIGRRIFTVEVTMLRRKRASSSDADSQSQSAKDDDEAGCEEEPEDASEGQPESAEDRSLAAERKPARPSPPAPRTMASLAASLAASSAASGRQSGRTRPSAGQCARSWRGRG